MLMGKGRRHANTMAHNHSYVNYDYLVYAIRAKTQVETFTRRGGNGLYSSLYIFHFGGRPPSQWGFGVVRALSMLLLLTDIPRRNRTVVPHHARPDFALGTVLVINGYCGSTANKLDWHVASPPLIARRAGEYQYSGVCVLSQPLPSIPPPRFHALSIVIRF